MGSEDGHINLEQWNRIESPEITPDILQPCDFGEGCYKHTLEKGQSFQQKGLRKLGSHIHKNENRYPSLIVYKNKFKID